MLHIPPTKVLISQPLKKPRATQKSLPFGKWRFREKEVRTMSQKQKRIRQKERTRQKNKREQKSGIKLAVLRFQTGGRRYGN